MNDESQTIETEQSAGATAAEQRTGRGRWIVTALAGVVALVLGGIALWFWGADIYTFLTDEKALEAIVVRAGVWGPLALILLNVVQIVIAPIPGYMVQLAAGYLYGPLWGGIYAAIGLMVGAMTAMWLARTLGRPVAVMLVGEKRLARWESVTHSDSVWVWLLLLLGPVGDVPYTLAGLSRVRYRMIFLITLFIRVPSVFLSTSIGGGAVPLVWFFVVVGIAGVVLLVGLRFKEPLSAWYERTLRAHANVALPTVLPEPVLERNNEDARGDD
jgi:uncharacterized membrane protein YdjX (TVP38/TMEM64 family)